METKKHKKSKHRNSDDEDYEEKRKKHKKSKKKDKKKDRDREEKRNKKKENTEEPELSAIEKFKMFKKQREADKCEDKVVDDLFRDFITSKLKQIESDSCRSGDGKVGKDSCPSHSVEELNKLLDDEINTMSSHNTDAHKQKKTEDSVKVQSKVSKDKASVKPNEEEKPLTKLTEVHAFNDPTKLGSIILKLGNKEGRNSKNSENVKTHAEKTEPCLPKEKDILRTTEVAASVTASVSKELVFAHASVDPTVNNKNANSNINNTGETSIITGPVFGPMLPRSIVVGEKKETAEEAKPDTTKKPLGFKNFGIKLSATSAELIQSGEIHKKGKRLEEGEVLTSSSGNSDSSETEVEGDDDSDDVDVSETGSISDSGGESKSKKKKKKKKGKHKKKKRKEKEEVLVVGKSGSKRKVSIPSRSRSKSPKKSKTTRSHSHSRDRYRRRSRSHSHERSKRSRSHSRSRGKSHRSRSRSRSKRSRSKSSKRTRSRDRRSRSKGYRSRSHSRKTRSRSRSPVRFWRSKYGDFDAYKFLKGKRERSKSRSRSPEREHDRFIEKEKKRLEDLRLKIDKAKLREIAIQNALNNAKTGGPKLDITIKSGGKSVEELTEYCKKIQEKEQQRKKLRTKYESSSEEEEGGRHSDDEDFHHPFEVKEAGSIVLDIKNAKSLPIVSPQERLAQSAQLRITFPVSSGSQHRDKEWVPVEPEPVPPPQPPKSSPAGAIPALMPPPPPQKPKPEVKVFEEPSQAPADISSIVSERLAAMKKLQDNPNDVAAKIVLTKAQKQASQWAQSKNLPGQFIGSTGANILSQQELMGDKKRQAWLKKVLSRRGMQPLWWILGHNLIIENCSLVKTL